jgi:hypothetical protein
MIESTERCEDKCIDAANWDKAMYYKWLRVPSA